ncbi:MAG: transglutaminase TgpA family protein [Silanimonas sp.]
MSSAAPPTLTPALRRAVVAAVLAAALPLLLHLPETVAAGIGAVALVSGWSALRRPLPLPLRLLLVVVITGAVLVGFGFRVGRDAGSALMLSMLVLKLSELRDFDDAKRVVAYALFASFAAFLQDQGPITVALGRLAAIGVLLAIARLAEAPAAPKPLRRELPALAQALTLALPLALVGFWLFPRLPSPLWGLPENAVARTGVSESMAPGDWIDLMANDRPAFRVRFDGPTPPTDTLYWRGPVLTRFDGREWTRNEWLGGFPAPALPSAPETGGITYTLTLEPTDRRYVFALESPAGWSPELELGFDASLRSRTPLRSLSQHRLRALPPQPYEPTLDRGLRQSFLRLPDGFNPRTLQRAHEWRAVSADDRAYVQRVLTWFNAEHAYSISAPPLGRHTADEFLFETREGFCEHFSSAFVILMRGAGIPARVVTGYTGGVPNRVGGYWVVRQMDAHAWSEIWLEGEGWVRVDPTAAVAPERIYDTLEDFAGESGFGGALRPMFDIGDSLREAWNNFVVGYDALRQTELLQNLGWRGAGAAQVGQAFVIAAGIALGLTLVVLLWPPRGERDPLLRAWRDFLKRCAKRGVAKRSDETAEAFLRRLRKASAPGSDAAALVERFIAFRYAPATDDASQERIALTEAMKRFRPG